MADYKPLDFSKFETRLLQLLPPETEETGELEDDLVECRLKHGVSLLDPPTYHALSYCWGQPKDTTRILVDDRKVEVTTNLETALRELRRGTKGCDLLWVDALCINQQDPYEKSYQILRMGQIYASAALVIAWLGPAGGEDTLLDRGIAKHLSQNPFWTRVWIIQEISRARKVDVMCGRTSQSWIDVIKTASSKKAKSKPANPSLQNGIPFIDEETLLSDIIEPLNRFRSRELNDGFGNKRLTLLQALVETRHSMATDPRDKIYALLGITSDGPSVIAMSNYIEKVPTVYSQSAQRIIVGQQQVSAILLASRARQTEPGTPSWMPNWSAFGDIVIPPWILRCIYCSRASTAIMMKIKNTSDLHLPIRRDVDIKEVFASLDRNLGKRHCNLPKISDRRFVEMLFDVFTEGAWWDPRA